MHGLSSASFQHTNHRLYDYASPFPPITDASEDIPPYIMSATVTALEIEKQKKALPTSVASQVYAMMLAWFTMQPSPTNSSHEMRKIFERIVEEQEHDKEKLETLSRHYQKLFLQQEEKYEEKRHTQQRRAEDASQAAKVRSPDPAGIIILPFDFHALAPEEKIQYILFLQKFRQEWLLVHTGLESNATHTPALEGIAVTKLREDVRLMTALRSSLGIITFARLADSEQVMHNILKPDILEHALRLIALDATAFQRTVTEMGNGIPKGARGPLYTAGLLSPEPESASETTEHSHNTLTYKPKHNASVQQDAEDADKK